MSPNKENKNLSSRLPLICGLIVLVCVALLLGYNLLRPEESSRTDVPPADAPAVGLSPEEVSDYASCAAGEAAAEWEAYLLAYDPDGSKLANAMGSEELGQGYTLYRVYTSEMALKLDTICQSRGLKLNQSMSFFYNAPELFAAAGTGEFLSREEECVGYLFDSGSFHVDSSYREVSFRFDLQKKDSFSESLLALPGEEDECWVYVSHGTPLLLSLGPERCLIHTALKGCYITVTVPQGAASAESSGISGAFLESLAESIYWDRLEA